MEISRNRYLDRLIAHKGNQRVKIVTGIRRCGKSFLLFQLFKRHLLESGVRPSHIIEIQLEDRSNKELRDPDKCLAFIKKQVRDTKPYYLLIDEIQLMPEFEDVLNSCLHIQNLDTYVTGSNSKFLSKDIITEFRGRGDELYLRPLSFSEFRTTCEDMSFDDAWKEYVTYGGLPYCALLPTREEKADYLKHLFDEVFVRDIVDRHKLQNDAELEILLNIVSSAVGSLTNPKKLEQTFQSVRQQKLTDDTISRYLDYCEEAYLIKKAFRYDIKGRKYIGTPLKYYFTDVGLRNALLNFRQSEENHLMENIIFNELCVRGFSVDVGIVEYNYKDEEGKSKRRQVEVDFVVNKTNLRYYIQSAFAIPDDEKRNQETNSLRRIGDSYQRIVVQRDLHLPYYDENGIYYIGLEDFLLKFIDEM